MAGRKFSLSRYLRERTAEIDPLFAFDAASEPGAKKWRAKALAKARDLLGEQPEFVPLDAEVIDKTETESYRCERVVFDADPHSSVPALVFVPQSLSKPAPAVICLHDFGSSKDECDYARELAIRGYVALAFDLHCFGERANSHERAPDEEPCERLCGIASLLGISIVALHVHDTMRAAEYLLERPEVDDRRLACVGLGLGGLVAMWAAGMDKRFKAAVVAGCLCEIDDLFGSQAIPPGPTCLPAFRRYFDLCDIAALIAPRPLLIQSGARDALMPIESARRAYCKVEAAYAAWDAPGSVSHYIFDGAHRFDTPAALEWLDREF